MSGPHRRWKPAALTWAVAGCVLVGIALLSYTPAASWLNQYQQSRLIASYNQQLRAEQEAAAGREDSPNQALAAARAYNQQLIFGAVVEANTNVPTGEQAPDSQYWSLLLGPAEVMARLRIPAIDVDLPVYHGTSDLTLMRGAGHLRGTSLPVGGDSTHAVITAHRGLAEAEMFTNLDRLGVGDQIIVESFGEVLAYQVVETQVVAPEDSQALRAQAGRDLLTLVTCTPLGINSHRILVTAERVLPTPQEAQEAAMQESELPRFPWWAVASGAGVLAVIGFVWRAGYRDAQRIVSKREPLAASQPD